MRIKFDMPLNSLIPAMLVVVMAWASLWLFDLRRFGHCQDWLALPPALARFPRWREFCQTGFTCKLPMSRAIAWMSVIGRLASCQTSLNAELEAMLASGQIVGW